MFIVDYNFENPEANILVKQQDIFQNTLTIKSVHCYYDTISCYKYTNEWTDDKGETHFSFERGLSNGSICCSPHFEVPIDVVYKSNPQGEFIYITLWGGPTSKRLIFNIDGKLNIDLIRQEDLEEDFSRGVWSSESYDAAIGKKRYDEEKHRYYQQRGTGFTRLFFEITKEQLQKLCSATTLLLQTSTEEGSVQFEGDASCFITILQALYNEAFDNTKYPESIEEALAILETSAANIQVNNDIELSSKNNFYKNKNTIIILVTSFLVIFIFIMMLSTCSI